MSPTNTPSFVPANPTTVTTRSSHRSLSSLVSPSPTPLSVGPRPSHTPTLAPRAQLARLDLPLAQPPSVAGPNDTALLLFRSDLRLDDHPALVAALENCSTVVPVFCFDPRHFGRTEHGFDKTGKYRARFLIQSVSALRDALRARGSDLVVKIGRPEDVLPQLASQLSASAIYLHREVTFEEQAVEKALTEALSKRNVDLRLSWANTLYHSDDMPFSIEYMPDVYSDFREAVEQRGRIREPLETPKEIPPIPSHIEVGEVPSLSDLGIANLDTAPCDGICAVHGGEKEAMRRVQTYVNDSRKRGDNLSDPQGGLSMHIGADFSCRISPWLAVGCVSPRRIFHQMAESGISKPSLMRSSTYFELVWRDFFRCITAKYSAKRAAAASRNPARANVTPFAVPARV